MKHSDYDERPRRLCRDSERGVILGVCAGIADHLDCPLWLMRVCVLALAWIFTVPTVIGYIVAALVMPERPLRYYGEGDERTFWHSSNHRS